MFAKFTVLAAAALLAAGAANAQVGVTADLGSTGVGFHVVVPMETYLNGRFGANYFRHDFDKTSDGVDYDIKGKLQTFDVLFDWYLTEGSSFHLTGGLVYNGNKFNAKAKPNGLGGFTLNGHAYSATDVGLLTGRIDYRKAAPYLGIGWPARRTGPRMSISASSTRAIRTCSWPASAARCRTRSARPSPATSPWNACACATTWMR
jgi:hypothetical protein